MVALANPNKKDQKTQESSDGVAGEWESVRLAAASRRRWKWGVLAGVLIATGSAAGFLVGVGGEETRPVAVLTADLPAGHVINAQDVSLVNMVEVEGIRLLSPDAVEGMVLTRPVPAGSPLVAGSVGDSALWPEPGQAVVGVPVGPLPRGLEAGSTVDLITAAPGEAAGDGGGEDSGLEGSSGVVTAVVHRVMAEESDGFGSGGQVLEVVLPRHQATYLSWAVADGQAQVAVVNPYDRVQAVEEGAGDE